MDIDSSELEEITEKKCCRCRKIKPIKDYPRKKSGGTYKTCLECRFGTAGISYKKDSDNNFTEDVLTDESLKIKFGDSSEEEENKSEEEGCPCYCHDTLTEFKIKALTNIMRALTDTLDNINIK